jgi:hypothetical protein
LETHEGALAQFLAAGGRHLKVDAFPPKPDDQRIVLQLSAEIGVDPANPTITFAMSAAGAQKVIENLNLATVEADKGR